MSSSELVNAIKGLTGVFAEILDQRSGDKARALSNSLFEQDRRLLGMLRITPANELQQLTEELRAEDPAMADIFARFVEAIRVQIRSPFNRDTGFTRINPDHYFDLTTGEVMIRLTMLRREGECITCDQDLEDLLWLASAFLRSARRALQSLDNTSGLRVNLGEHFQENLDSGETEIAEIKRLAERVIANAREQDVRAAEASATA